MGLNKLSRPHPFLERRLRIKNVLQLIINILFPGKFPGSREMDKNVPVSREVNYGQFWETLVCSARMYVFSCCACCLVARVVLLRVLSCCTCCLIARVVLLRVLSCCACSLIARVVLLHVLSYCTCGLIARFIFKYRESLPFNWVIISNDIYSL